MNTLWMVKSLGGKASCVAISPNDLNANEMPEALPEWPELWRNAQPYLQELRALRHGHRDVFDDEAIRAEDKCVAFTPDNLTIDNMR
eukprot:1158281-Pelagomonas_calceolata.AAC.3